MEHVQKKPEYMVQRAAAVGQEKMFYLESIHQIESFESLEEDWYSLLNVAHHHHPVVSWPFGLDALLQEVQHLSQTCLQLLTSVKLIGVWHPDMEVTCW